MPQIMWWAELPSNNSAYVDTSQCRSLSVLFSNG